MNIIYSAFLVVVLFVQVAYGQSLKINARYLDSLKWCLVKEPNLQIKTAIYNKISEEFEKVYESDSIIFYGEKALELARIVKNKNEEANAYFNLAMANRIGYDRRDYLRARRNYFENINAAISCYQEIGDRKNLAESYLLLGSYYNRFGMPPSAYEYYIKGLDIFKKIKDDTGVARSYSFLGQFYDVHGKSKEALYYFDSAIKTFETLKDTMELIYTLARYSYCLRSLNRGSEQEEAMRRVYELAKDTQNKYLLADIYSDYGEALIFNKKNGEAVSFLKQSYLLLQPFNADKLLSIVCVNLARAYSAEENFAEAYKYQKLATDYQANYNNKLNKESLEEQLSALRVETQSKEQRENLLIVIIISVILLSLLVLLAVLYRYKIKTNKILEERSNIVRRHNDELDALNHSLEQKVIKRTEELSSNNISLIKEVERRIQAERSLHESEIRYRTLIESSPDAIIVQSEKEVLFVNNVLVGMTGAKDRESVIEGAKSIFSHPDYQETILKRRELMFVRNETPPPIEMKIFRFDGTPLLVEVRSFIINYGGIKAMQSIIRDITKEKKAETELLKLSKAVEQSSAVIVITDTNGIIEYVNPKFVEVSGYSVQEALGKTPRIVKSGKMPQEMYEELWATLKAGKEWHGEFLNKKKNGELFWELCLISPIKDEKGEIINFIAVKEDITQKMQMQEELVRSKLEAEEANRLKSTLLSNVSHEFRTPLNGIIGLSQILKEIVTDASHADMAEKITMSGRRLANTLNSVLLLTELENKSFLVHRNKINLTAFCESLKKKYERTANEQRLDFNTILPSKIIYVNADENLLHKLIAGLVSNAIKYTRQGSVTVKLDTVISADGKEEALIRIIDTGIGLSHTDQQIIFKEFIQVSEGFNRNFEGLGLGLAITKKLADMENYELTVNSELGKGSVFTVKIPVEEIVAEEVNPESVPQSAENPDTVVTEVVKGIPSILIVEDNVVNIEVVQHFLAGKCNLKSAVNGFKAIQLAMKSRFDVLLLDINLGKGLDGIGTLKEIREIDGYEKVPAYAITGYAADKDIDNILDSGFTGLLAKPFNKPELLELLAEYLPKE